MVTLRNIPGGPWPRLRPGQRVRLRLGRGTGTGRVIKALREDYYRVAVRKGVTVTRHASKLKLAARSAQAGEG